jgi:hypothetical protein
MAVKRFQQDHNLKVDGRVGDDTWAELFLGGPITHIPTPPPKTFGQFTAARIVTAMRNKNFRLDEGLFRSNLIYVEGMNVDGQSNQHIKNTFDDVRSLVVILPEGPKLLGIWEATTRPGKYWTEHRMNPRGAARVRLGQQTAWIMGKYNGMNALRQDGYLELTRDPDETYERYGPLYRSNDTGIHHHGGYNYPHDDLGRSSAGCLVGRSMDEHEVAMQFLKKDERFRADSNFHFTSTILEYKDLPEIEIA